MSSVSDGYERFDQVTDVQWASRREGCEEVRAAGGLRTGDTTVARREQDGSTAGTELCEEAADLDSVVLGDGLLVVTVTSSELCGAVSIEKGNV